MIPKIIASKLHHFHQIDSSNNHAIDKIRQNDIQEGEVFWTDFQTSGKGQKGNVWESEASQNLLLSIYLKPYFIKPDRQFILSQFVSVGIVEWLSSLNIESSIKWPNDILVGDQKLGGILIENILKGNLIEHSVIGIGMNVFQTTFSKLLHEKPVFSPINMQSFVSSPLQIDVLVRELCDVLNHYYYTLMHNPTIIQDKYISYLFRKGIWSNYEYRNQLIEAKIEGIDTQGKLMLSSIYGEKISCDLKEIIFLR